MVRLIGNIMADRRGALVSLMLLVCALAVVAEDVTFLNNRRQWEKLPTATLMQLGKDFMNVKNLPDSAMLAYSIIANRYNENLKGEELKQCIRATCYVGRIYDDLYNSKYEAYKWYLKAKDLAEKHQYRTFIPVLLNDIGNLYLGLSNILHDNELFEEAISFYKDAFWNAIESKSLDLLPVIVINLNYYACSKNAFTQTQKEIETYDRQSIPNSARLKEFADHINSGAKLFYQRKFDQAIEVFRSTPINSLKSDANGVDLLIMLYEFVYFAQMENCQKNDALATLNYILSLIESENSVFISEAYGQLAEFYRIDNNVELADKYELLWRRSTDSIAQATQANSVNTVRFLHEIDKMNEEQQALVVKQKHDRQMLWIVGAAALVAFVLLVLLYINRQRIQENYRQLYEKNQALLAAEDARLQAAEAEHVTEVVPEAPKYSHNQMDDDVMDELWLQIKHVMETSEEIYDEQFTIDQLAELIGAKKNYVSQTINTKTGQAFSVLLNEYRIREACRRMNDREHYGNFSVEGIAQSVGYGSRSHFAKLFKAATGVPPSAYMKMCKEGTSPATSMRPKAGEGL